MNKTKIEWCDYTFDPVTGCLHGCSYCYARRQAERFGGATIKDNVIFENKEPAHDKNGRINPYPVGFSPTIHAYKLGEPQRVERPSTIFVTSMGDLFGEWVPYSWIAAVFEAAAKAPQHRYLFLTKNPGRYVELAKDGKLPADPNYWYGSTATDEDMPIFTSDVHNTFVSIEPMIGDFGKAGSGGVNLVKWAIIGAMTGPGKERYRPKAESVANIVEACKAAGTPLFMKDSMRPIVGDNMVRQLPEGITLPTKRRKPNV